MPGKIKFKGKKILVKGKRVACGCCLTCCMYPAKALNSNLYTEDDLPDEVFIDEKIYKRSKTAYFKGRKKKIYLEGNAWAMKDEFGNISLRKCLITTGDKVKDLFADSYVATINYESGLSESGVLQRITAPNPGPFPTRFPPCVWEELDPPETRQRWFLYYHPAGYLCTEEYPPNVACISITPGTESYLYKWNLDTGDGVSKKIDGIQNTPVGNYETYFQEQESITVE